MDYNTIAQEQTCKAFLICSSQIYLTNNNTAALWYRGKQEFMSVDQLRRIDKPSTISD